VFPSFLTAPPPIAIFRLPCGKLQDKACQPLFYIQDAMEIMRQLHAAFSFIVAAL
jgi:hypothetical protein